MRAKRSFTIWSFLLVLLFNGIMIGGFFYMAREILDGLQQWITPFLGTEAPDAGEDIRLAYTNMGNLISQTQRYLAPVVLGGGGVATLLLWLTVLATGRRLINRAAGEALASAPMPETKAAKPKAEAAPAAEPRYTQPSPGAAVQILSILQRDGRFIDFLQEDLSLYDDAQIGAAVRSVHEGCKEAIGQHMELKPVFEEGEGIEITVPPGFDSRAIRLTGNVTGDPPFQGVLRHRGWRIQRIQLPQPTSDQREGWILAPAEVEVNG